MKNTITSSRSLVCLLASLVVLAGCGSQDSQQADLRFASVDTGELRHASSSGTPQLKQTATFNQQPDSADSIIIGLDADMTSGSAASGEAIRRGALLAIEQLNRKGGVLGRKIELIVRDHRGNPDRGVDNIREFSAMPNLLAVVGGIHTPVALQELTTIHEKKVLYLGPWAAGTGVADNGYEPNYVFRISVRDEYAGGFLVDESLKRGFTRIGLLLERTGWGRSNLTAMTAALKKNQLEPACVEWVNWGERDVDLQIKNLQKAETQVVLVVCNPLEGVSIVNAMASLPASQRLPIVSHWGISAGNFFELAKSNLDGVDLTFLQTYSFIAPRYPERAQTLIDEYARRFDCQSPRKIFSPVGTAHAYELVMMIASTVQSCQSLNTAVVRDALENQAFYSGIIRDYEPPFSAELHDALDRSDFILARYDSDGAIVPAHPGE